MHAELDLLPEGGRQGGTHTVLAVWRTTVSVSRTVTKQIIRSFSKYTGAVDVVCIRALQLPVFNRTAFIYLTTVSYPLDKSHSCSDVKAPFSSKARTVTRHWMDERQCQWSCSVLWRSSPCAHLLYMSVCARCCSKHWPSYWRKYRGETGSFLKYTTKWNVFVSNAAAFSSAAANMQNLS